MKLTSDSETLAENKALILYILAKISEPITNIALFELVLSIENIYTCMPCTLNSISSDYDSTFVYEVGKIVSVDNFDDDRWNECAPGIHFFINREEAVKY